MRHPVLWIAVTFTLGLAACGGDDARTDEVTNPLGDLIDEADPEASFGKPGGGQIELTDEIMESFVALSRTMRDEGVKGPTEAMLAAHHLDVRTYGAIASLVTRTTTSVFASDARKALEKSIAKAKERLAGTGGSERQTLERKIATQEAQLDQLSTWGGNTDLDRKNREVIQRWLPKLRGHGEGR